MSQDIYVDYEQLEGSIAELESQSQDYAAKWHLLIEFADELCTLPAWAGKGAGAFSLEMQEAIVPSILALYDALQASGSALRAVGRTYQHGEDDSASRFRSIMEAIRKGIEAAVGSLFPVNPETSSGPNLKSKYYKDVDYVGDEIPLFIADTSNPYFNMDDFIRDINPGERPVLMLVHGFGAHDSAIGDNGGFELSAQWYNETYGHLPESQRPIIVGFAWDATEGFDLMDGTQNIEEYRNANDNAEKASHEFAKMVEQINYFYPESNVSVIAHSLGNRVVLEGIAEGDLEISNYLALQGAVDVNELSSDGRYADALNTEELGYMGASYSSKDLALRFGHETVYEDSLGRFAPRVTERSVTLYDFGENAEWGMNHFGYEDVKRNDDGSLETGVVMETIEDFFGSDGSRFQRGTIPRGLLFDWERDPNSPVLG